MIPTIPSTPCQSHQRPANTKTTPAKVLKNSPIAPPLLEKLGHHPNENIERQDSKMRGGSKAIILRPEDFKMGDYSNRKLWTIASS